MAYKKGTIRLSAAFTEAEYEQLKKILKLTGCRSFSQYFKLKVKQDINFFRGGLIDGSMGSNC